MSEAIFLAEGQTAPYPILTTMRDFPALYEARLRPEAFVPDVDLHAALADSAALQGHRPVDEDI
ncbi:hypothetical protein HLH36_06460 [Gluconacetobacter aggeris]|uniref:Uncharacterized protein n=1 Tax=Gluconacetobacter aggeris TaxID=1286186 RepID=A0A7W4ISL1_9PROT|nr:hypothetical protein [Gluconacetobacter aggeris]MBB2168002.1 hypothetical protein [Gluconacetobacter aggeris]